jgi:hypothetical protein
LYYLTGYEGTLRRQGLFSGPNNYGYFLVAFFPLVLLFFSEKISQIKQWTMIQRINAGVITLWIFAMVMTLSRAVILGGVLVLILLNWSCSREKKKLLFRGGGVVLLLLVALSLLKRDSTLGHLTSKL